jgi:fructose-1,6-bisphosphatase/sedoheptulose 1,7-bisphosphatase-like protein
MGKQKEGGSKMFGKVNRKWLLGFVSMVAIAIFISCGIAVAGVEDLYNLRPQQGKSKAAQQDMAQELKPFSDSVPVPLQKSSSFKTGYEPVNSNYVEDNFAVKASTMTAVILTEAELRGAALGVTDKKEISKIKDLADGQAKKIYEEEAKRGNIILVVRVSEGIGRDEVAESLKANDVIVADELLGELNDVKNAIDNGHRQYTAKSGKTYRIKNAIIDVLEGTNRFVDNVGGKGLNELKISESGATSVIVTGDGKLLCNCPDIYAYGLFTLVPKEKRQEFINNPLDPEVIANDPAQMENFLKRIADANGISINDLEVVLMDRPREAQNLAELRKLQGKYNNLEVTTIKDGTVAHCLLATFGRKEGKHKVVLTVGGAPEVSMNTVVASLFKTEGGLASLRICSKNLNTTLDGKDAQDMKRRYAFSRDEIDELLNLRPDDAWDIINGKKLFTQEDVEDGDADIDGAFSFITHNGVFGKNGVETVEGKTMVNLLRIGKLNGKPSVWFSQKTIDPYKDESEHFVDSIPDDKPLLAFTNTDSVNQAIKGIVEVTDKGVKILDDAELKATLVDRLVYDSVFNPDKQVVDLCRKLIKDIAVAEGMKLNSVYNLYVQKAFDHRHYSFPAINVRGQAYNTARAIFESAVENKVKFFILEIAKSEIGYSGQRPAEFTASMLAAGIKEGFKGDVYLQGDHFQIDTKLFFGDSEKGIAADPVKAVNDIKALIREAVIAGFYQIDLDMSPAVLSKKPTVNEQQENNYKLTAELTAYVRALERELGLDKERIVINLGGEIGEIGKGMAEGENKNSTVEEKIAFTDGYLGELDRLSKEAGYALKPTTKTAVQTGTMHGGVKDKNGNIIKAKVSFNTLAETGQVSRQKYHEAGDVNHGASTLPEENHVLFAGKPVPAGVEIDPKLLSEENKVILSENPAAEVHLATEYQNTTMDHPAFPKKLLEAIRTWTMNFAEKKKLAKAGDSPKKTFDDNRKNSWVNFKPQVWNMSTDRQTAIRKDLKKKFDTVFKNLGVTEIRDSYLQSLDTKVNSDFLDADFDGVMQAIKGNTQGAIVVSANTIFKNAGTIEALQKVKEAQKNIKIVVWADNPEAQEKLNVMGVAEIADIIGTKGLGEVLNILTQAGIASDKVMLYNSSYDLKDIAAEFKIDDAGVDQLFAEKGLKVTNIKSSDVAGNNINAMPLLIARGIAAIFQDEQPVVDKYKELSQNYSKKSDKFQISQQDLNRLNDLTSQITVAPLVNVSQKEVAQAQLTYEATVDQI